MLHTRQDIQRLKLSYQQTLANQLVTAVLILDQKLNICYLNPAAEALLIKSLYKLYGSPFDLIFENTSITKNDYCKITKVQPAEAVMILLQNSILGSAYKALAMEKSRLIALSNLLKNVHFKKISYSSGKSNLLNVCKAIKKDLAN